MQPANLHKIFFRRKARHDGLCHLSPHSQIFYCCYPRGICRRLFGKKVRKEVRQTVIISTSVSASLYVFTYVCFIFFYTFVWSLPKLYISLISVLRKLIECSLERHANFTNMKQIDNSEKSRFFFNSSTDWLEVVGNFISTSSCGYLDFFYYVHSEVYKATRWIWDDNLKAAMNR